MLSLLISFLIVLLVVCVIAWLVAWIISNIPGAPAGARNIVYAVAGIILLIWVLYHIGPALGIH